MRAELDVIASGAELAKERVAFSDSMTVVAIAHKNSLEK
jgi:hypothetical protein